MATKRRKSNRGIAAIDEPYFLRTGSNWKRIIPEKILWMEAKGSEILVATDEGVHKTINSLKSLEEKLPGGFFQRIHKSYIVNLHRVDEIPGRFVRIGERSIPIGEKYRKCFMRRVRLL